MSSLIREETDTIASKRKAEVKREFGDLGPRLSLGSFLGHTDNVLTKR